MRPRYLEPNHHLLTADKLFAPVTRRYDRHSILSAERECRHTTGDECRPDDPANDFALA